MMQCILVVIVDSSEAILSFASWSANSLFIMLGVL